MLEYAKSLLQKVSFDRYLFIKELKKSVDWLDVDDKRRLHSWSLTTFYHLYGKDIKDVFHS
ncbi:MAG: hypothetical protein U9R19_18075 [Bacteroidota bacterium]|nr:hypothetical protein [Bacteroidota bacterium]